MHALCLSVLAPLLAMTAPVDDIQKTRHFERFASAPENIQIQEPARSFYIGVHGSYADDVDFGIGGRLVWLLEDLQENLELITSFDYFFPDVGVDFPGVEVDADYFEVNVNLAYAFETTGSVDPYAGAGINFAHASGSVELPFIGNVNASDTRAGLNLLGGARFDREPVLPFVEIRLELKGGEQFSVTGGILF